jgi:hypothetical protein
MLAKSVTEVRYCTREIDSDTEDAGPWLTCDHLVKGRLKSDLDWLNEIVSPKPYLSGKSADDSHGDGRCVVGGGGSY